MSEVLNYIHLADKLQRALDAGVSEVTVDVNAPAGSEGSSSRLKLDRRQTADLIMWLLLEAPWVSPDAKVLAK